MQSSTATSFFDEQGKYLTSFQRKLLIHSLQENLPSQYRLRVEIMLLADLGKTQTQICQALGCSPATARHWISVARSGQAHNWNNNPIGRPSTVDDRFLERLKELVSQNPREFGYPFQRWTSQWLSKHLSKELGIHVGDRHIRRLLKDMGLSTRPKQECPNEENNHSDFSTNNNIVIRDLSSVSELESSISWAPFSFKIN